MAEEFDLGGLLRQAQELQASLSAAREQAASTVVEGQAGGGVVKVAMTASGEFRSVSIAAEVVDPTDVEMLEDLVLAALRDASVRADEVQSSAGPDLSQLGLGELDLGSLGLGGLDLGGAGDVGGAGDLDAAGGSGGAGASRPEQGGAAPA
jgi:nucleoid-associated protein EbfC